MHHMNTPDADRVRLTISVTPEVHETFARLAKAGSMSLSRAMGEWLADTVEAAQFMAAKMEEARAAPKKVMREMHAYALGLADETGSLIEGIRQGAAAERKAKRAPVPPVPTPRPVIRGVKVPKQGQASRGKRS